MSHNISICGCVKFPFGPLRIPGIGVPFNKFHHMGLESLILKQIHFSISHEDPSLNMVNKDIAGKHISQKKTDCPSITDFPPPFFRHMFIKSYLVMRHAWVRLQLSLFHLVPVAVRPDVLRSLRSVQGESHDLQEGRMIGSTSKTRAHKKTTQTLPC